MRNIDNGMVSRYYDHRPRPLRPGSLFAEAEYAMEPKQQRKTLRLSPKGNGKNAKFIITRIYCQRNNPKCWRYGIEVYPGNQQFAGLYSMKHVECGLAKHNMTVKIVDGKYVFGRRSA